MIVDRPTRHAISPSTLRRLDIQEFDQVDPACLAPVAPWLRLTFALCAGLALVGTVLVSEALLLALAVIAFVGALSPTHPFDLIYNVVVRRFTRTAALPGRGAPTRFACGLGAGCLVAIAMLFRRGYATARRFVSGMAALVSATDICIPSLVYRLLFGWPTRRTPVVPEEVAR